MIPWTWNLTLALRLGCALGVGAGGVGIWHAWARRSWRLRNERMHRHFLDQMTERKSAEERLRRTLAMFQLTQDVTSAAGSARSLDEALQCSLDIICTYSGWPVGHVLRPEEGQAHLVPTGIWHLEDPHEHEAFLRRAERQPLRPSKGLPGRAWSVRRVAWSHFMDGDETSGLQARALEVGLTFGLAIPVLNDDELVAVLEFFSPPIPDPDPVVLDALSGAGRQLGLVAERLRDQETMGLLNGQLVELNEQKNQFLAIASHDLKNPLNAIALAGEAILLPDLETSERDDLARNVVKEAHRASRLIQRLLDVSAIESGRFQMQVKPVLLVDALVRVQTLFQERASAKGQAIRIEFPDGDPAALADSELLDQALENLVGNALKFMPVGPPVRTVHLSCRVQGEHAEIEIRDEGPGFSSDDRGRAFGRFVRLGARPTGGESSNGLGLSIVQKVIHAMHGTVELESQLGRGSTFRISLPLATQSSTSDAM